MTPIDPAALVAMLTAFFPVVSIDNLAAARQQYPGYFSGGTLIGAGDRLQLGDGSVYLLIYNGQWSCVGDTPDPAAAGVWDAGRIQAFFQSYGITVANTVIQLWLGYWASWGWKNPAYFLYRLQHAQELVDAGKATALPGDPSGDGLSLTPGPLTPADPTGILSPPSGPVFVPLVSGALGALDNVSPALDSVAAAVAANDPSPAVDSSASSNLDPAGAAHANTVQQLAGETIDDIAGATDGQSSAIPGNRSTYDEQPPPDQPVPDPGDPPGGPGHQPGGPPSI